MKRIAIPWAAALAVVVLAGAAGWLVGRSSGGGGRLDAEREVDRLRREKRALEERADTLSARLRERQVEPPEVAPPRDESAMPSAAVREPAEDPTLLAEKRLRRIAEIRDAADGWFESGKGKEALAALKELAALVPEGREAAMALATRINGDVNGEGKLGLSQMVFYTSLADPAIQGLMLWSLENPSSTDFRTMTAYSLPWTLPPEKTVASFVKALSSEKDAQVQRALVQNLAWMRNPEADAKLLSVLRDPARDAALRALVATELTASNDPEVLRTIEDMALSETDPDVRRAAGTAMRILNPPATGFLVTGTLPQSQAAIAGVEEGDILVSYAGRRVSDLDALRAAASAAKGDEAVEIVVVRGDREVTLMLRPGQMGVYGRDVKAK